jgi:hypothetical protein
MTPATGHVGAGASSCVGDAVAPVAGEVVVVRVVVVVVWVEVVVAWVAVVVVWVDVLAVVAVVAVAADVSVAVVAGVVAAVVVAGTVVVVVGTLTVVVSLVVVGGASARATATPHANSSAAATPVITRCSGIALIMEAVQAEPSLSRTASIAWPPAGQCRRRTRPGRSRLPW